MCQMCVLTVDGFLAGETRGSRGTQGKEERKGRRVTPVKLGRRVREGQLEQTARLGRKGLRA